MANPHPSRKFKVKDNKFEIVDQADQTKKLVFQCSGITTGTTATFTAPAASGTLVTLAGTETLTNKTLTAPVVSAPVLSGSATGTYTLAGTPTITSPTVTGASMTTSTLSTGTLGGDLINSSMKRCSADVTFTSNVVLADVTGLTGIALTAGATYAFEINLQTNMSTNGGIAAAFKFTTATLTSLQLKSTLLAASSMVNEARFTTATDAALWFDTVAAAFLEIRVVGTMVVNAGGTVAIQACQGTSHGDTTTVYAGSTARFTRIA